MGNSNQSRHLQDELDISALCGHPLTFHSLHSETVRLSHDARQAKRVTGVRGICFSNRPICIGERIYICITETTLKWQGALRVGLLPDNPSLLNIADLPTYACPDITYEQGYWAKAIPDSAARQGNIIFIYVTSNGDLIYGLNGKEIGILFGGVQTDLPLWALVDLYGSTVSIELIITDNVQISPHLQSDSYQMSTGMLPPASWFSSTQVQIPDISPFYPITSVAYPPATVSSPAWPSQPNASLPILSSSSSSTSSYGAPQVLEIIDPMPFHTNSGRNVFFSHNRAVASRSQHDYCNGYVFTHRPLVPGERLVIGIIATTSEYSGGLTFGMTSCDPNGIREMMLPDDSDLLLDLPDYWVVHKDVYTKPEINDELTFHLMTSGEVRYSKNGHNVGTLMHVDTSLPLWAFIDIYGSTQQIKSLGVVTPLLISSSNTSLSKTLYSSPVHRINPNNEDHVDFKSKLSTANSCMVSDPYTGRRISEAYSSVSLSRDDSKQNMPVSSNETSRRHSYAEAPALPPKNFQIRSTLTGVKPNLSDARSISPLDLVLKVSDVPQSLPPPLIPVPIKASSCHRSDKVSSYQVSQTKPIEQPIQSQRPQVPARIKYGTNTLKTGSKAGAAKETGDTSQECVVCMEKAMDCALYMCGHMCMCYGCAIDLVNSRSALCPICREPIRDVIKIFRS